MPSLSDLELVIETSSPEGLKGTVRRKTDVRIAVTIAHSEAEVARGGMLHGSVVRVEKLPQGREIQNQSNLGILVPRNSEFAVGQTLPVSQITWS